MNNSRILSNFDIEDIAKKLKLNDLIFVGTQDLLETIPKNKRKNKFYIVNLDKQVINGGSGMGNHWVLLSTHTNQPFFFDSFGQPPAQRIYKFANCNNLIYSNEQIQSLNSEICGWFCLMVADMVYRYYKNNKSFDHFVDDFLKLGWNFGNEKNNYRIVLKYFSNVI